ncbi:hypothetical protein O2W14_01745 [Modestobacter sp. VKM Ac-2986]|uniref:hypothetical protein n=1 Tax=Modestobacter sp. VKM Ac-2986 TaxID=3004140 RepID=UPI0022AA0EDD|nr:hypothetical protein [Modestobacter sp. VKM Ac-2986]MCZ2827556.1 hypothetical protein [Modestobacter sp. VKM Ac-2986]
MRIEHRLGTRLAGGLTAGLAALLLAGCGGSDEAPAAAATSSAASSAPSSSAAPSSESRTGSEVAAAAADALEQAGSAHASGTVGTGAEAQSLDLQLQGEDVSGSITIGDQTVQVLSVGGVSYLQAGADFWTSSGAPAEAVAMLDGRWVVVPAEQAADFAEVTLAGLAEELRNPSDGAYQDEVRTEQLDGQDVLVVTQEGGNEVYVAAGDPQYPLRTTTTGADAESVTIDGFGETVEIVAPTDALDLSDLGA